MRQPLGLRKSPAVSTVFHIRSHASLISASSCDSLQEQADGQRSIECVSGRGAEAAAGGNTGSVRRKAGKAAQQSSQPGAASSSQDEVWLGGIARQLNTILQAVGKWQEAEGRGGWSAAVGGSSISAQPSPSLLSADSVLVSDLLTTSAPAGGGQRKLI